MKPVRVRMGAAPLLMAGWLLAPPVGAQEHPPPQEPASDEVHGAHEDELHHRNAVGIVVGGTYESEEKDRFFTLGAEYLWRFGVGYNFEVGERYSIAPAVDLDYVREDGRWVWATVFAVTFGFDFRRATG